LDAAAGADTGVSPVDERGRTIGAAPFQVKFPHAGPAEEDEASKRHFVQAPFRVQNALYYRQEEPKMRAAALAFVLALSCVSATGAFSQTAAGNTCIRTTLIDHTKAPDDRTIIFAMKNGAVYQSTLPTICPQLSFNGFSYVATPPDQICGNLQSIRVIRTGSVCLLGPLVQITPTAAPNP
jgi:hypothetical protein